MLGFAMGATRAAIQERTSVAQGSKTADRLRNNLIAAIVAGSKFKILFSLGFALIWCACDVYRLYDAYSGLLFHWGYYAATGFGVGAFCYVVLSAIGFVINQGNDGLSESAPHNIHVRSESGDGYFGRRVFGLSFIVLMISWVPFVIAFFPGSITFDATRQLQCFYGIIDWTSHHPPFISMIMGSITWLGRAISGSDYAALALYVIVYYVFQAIVCAVVVKECYVVTKRKGFAIVPLLFFAVVPLFGANAQTIWKDNLYMCFFALFFVGLLRVCRNPSAPDGLLRSYGLCGAGGLLAALCRKEALVIVAVSLVFALILGGKKPKKICARFAALIAAVVMPYCIFTYVIVPSVGIGPGSSVEALSVPMQQVARYARDNLDGLTNEELTQYDKYWSGGAQEVAELYQPNYADPVKNAFLEENLGDFLPFYLEWSVGHPFEFAESLWASTYGYFYIGQTTGAPPVMVLFYDTALDQVYEYEYLPVFSELRDLLSRWCSVWSDKPVLQWFVLPGLYVWLLIACLCYSIRRKAPPGMLAAVFMPLALTVAAACVSPVDGYLRYVFGLVMVMPLMLSYSMLFCFVPSDSNNSV